MDTSLLWTVPLVPAKCQYIFSIKKTSITRTLSNMDNITSRAREQIHQLNLFLTGTAQWERFVFSTISFLWLQIKVNQLFHCPYNQISICCHSVYRHVITAIYHQDFLSSLEPFKWRHIDDLYNYWHLWYGHFALSLRCPFR